MSEEMVLSIGTETLKTTLYLAAPLLLVAMIVGVLVSIFQAVTQINEATLTFIPKVVAILLVLTAMGPWMLEILQTYTIQVLGGAGGWMK